MAGNKDDLAISGGNCLSPQVKPICTRSPAQLQYPTCTVCHNMMLSLCGPPSLPHSLPRMQQRLQPHYSLTPRTLTNGAVQSGFSHFSPGVLL